MKMKKFLCLCTSPSRRISNSSLLKNIYLRSQKKSSFSELRFNSAQYGSHEFFSSNNDHIGSLLYNYLNNIVDLSLNEVNVHYLGHSDVVK